MESPGEWRYPRAGASRPQRPPQYQASLERGRETAISDLRQPGIRGWRRWRVGGALADPDRELQFYLTDYRSLYVAEVSAITRADVRKTDVSHVPQYYQTLDVAPECWFALSDIRRLIAEDTVSVIHELRNLRNVAYHDRPVSLYGGMVDLPLLVTRPDGRRFFDEAECVAVTDGRSWVEFDAAQGGVGAMEVELREAVRRRSMGPARSRITQYSGVSREGLSRSP